MEMLMADPLVDALDAYVDARVAKALAPLDARLAALEATPAPAPPVPPTPEPLPPPPTPTPTGGQPSPKALRMGMNLSHATYYTPSWPFVDLMRTSHVNGIGITDYSWMGTAGLPLDTDGWPREVRESQNAHTVITRMGGHYPAGEYTLSWEGQGRITLQGDASGTFTASPSKVKVTPTGSGIDMKIVLSSAGNPVRNVRFLMPGFSATAVFHPKFLEMLAPFSVLRFMDWGRTNDSKITAWSERTRPTHRTQMKGVAYEFMAMLCNAVGADAWVCVPHLTPVSYVEEMARLFKTHLNASLKVYLELSNECWNGGFSQTGWMEARSGSENVRQTYARLAVERFKAWEAAWGSRDRLVRVLSGQAANADVLRQILTAAGPGACDAIASAPYFGGSLGRDAAVATWAPDKIIEECFADLPRWLEVMQSHKLLADQHGVAHISYEGGQHLAAVGSLADNAALVAKLADANRNPKMEQVYSAYFDHWKASGSGLFCHFNDIYTPAKWGSWGMLEYQDQAPTPKSKAVTATANAWRS